MTAITSATMMPRGTPNLMLPSLNWPAGDQPVSAVMGLIMRATFMTLLAGNPPFCACSRTAFSSGAL
jgi:hypothetical protein